MRWDALFNDLEAQIAARSVAADESEIADLTRLEQSGVSLADRLRGQTQLTLRIRASGGVVFTGRLSHVGSEWVVLESELSTTLIPFFSIQLIEGVGRQMRQEHSAVQRRLGLAAALRALARDRARVVIYGASEGVRVEGIIDRVGSNFVEMAAVARGEQRRPGNVGGVFAIPFTGMAAVSSHP